MTPTGAMSVCGRYTLTGSLPDLVDVFDVPVPEFRYNPRYNIAPTQEAPVVAQDSRGRRMGLLRWGLVPSWARDPNIGSRLINARSETVAEKPAFRQAFRARRCLVPADGFFEWKQEGEGPDGKGSKQPYWIHLPGGEPFAFAGLWERWTLAEGDPLHTFTILTTEAAEAIRSIHPRMPVILPPGAWRRWLDPGAGAEELLGLLGPSIQVDFRAHPVSTLVNSPRNDRPACIEAVERG
jgi:putative SOS response-associated peptidase YedK